MKKMVLVVGALVAGGVVFAKGGCLTEGSDAPDQKLAAHLDETCKIARANIDNPVRGVKKLGAYLDKHAGHIFGEWGDLLATIERIPDDKKHDKRARLARERIHTSVVRCAPDWIVFIEAVQQDPEASAMVERFSERLSRTLEIIGGGNVRQLPLSLDRALTNAIPLRR